MRCRCLGNVHPVEHQLAPARIGHGAPEDARDELNEELLDNVHLAGARFDRMLKRLAG